MTVSSIARVFIIGLDGAGVYNQEAHTPHMDAFLKKGFITYHARTEFPSISGECWSSLFHGVSPLKHERTNERVDKEPYPDPNPYPSFMKVIQSARPDSKMAAFSCWSPIIRGIIEQSVDCHRFSAPDHILVEEIIEYLQENPDTESLFVQLDDVDSAGHRHGYGSDEYLQSITQADEYVGVILDAMERLDLLKDSLVILTTDHGGGGADHYGHGSDHPKDMNIFWGCVGPGIAAGHRIDDVTIGIKDTASIVLHALGLKQPEQWESKVPRGLFGEV